MDKGIRNRQCWCSLVRQCSRREKGSKEGRRDEDTVGADFFMEVTAITMTTGRVCGLAVFILSKQSWDVFQDDMYWGFTRICTTRKLFRSRPFIGTGSNKFQVKTKGHSIWFTRKMEPFTSQTNPVLCSSSQSCGNKADVISAIEQGAYVASAIQYSDGKYYLVPGFRSQFVRDGSKCAVGNLCPWYITAGNAGEFIEHLYWYMRLHTSYGKLKVSRWYIGSHRYNDYTTSYSGNVKMFIDSCWRIIYSHRENGDTVLGSKTSLKEFDLKGKRIRIVFDNVAMEANNIVIENDLVTAQLLDQIETPTATTLTHGDAVWKWVRIASDGTYLVDLYNVGSKRKRGIKRSTISASWFAENRQWNLVLSMTRNTVIQGSKSDLENAIRSGSKVRCVVRETPSKVLAVTSDNVEVNSGDVAVQFARLITFDDSNPLFVPFWRILILSTKEEMTETH